jgi:hypothetical protein
MAIGKAQPERQHGTPAPSESERTLVYLAVRERRSRLSLNELDDLDRPFEALSGHPVQKRRRTTVWRFPTLESALPAASSTAFHAGIAGGLKGALIVVPNPRFLLKKARAIRRCKCLLRLAHFGQVLAIAGPTSNINRLVSSSHESIKFRSLPPRRLKLLTLDAPQPIVDIQYAFNSQANPPHVPAMFRLRPLSWVQSNGEQWRGLLKEAQRDFQGLSWPSPNDKMRLRDRITEAFQITKASQTWRIVAGDGFALLGALIIASGLVGGLALPALSGPGNARDLLLSLSIGVASAILFLLVTAIPYAFGVESDRVYFAYYALIHR